MTSGLDPFAPQPSDDPFAPLEPGPPISYGMPRGAGWQFSGPQPPFSPPVPPGKPRLNTFAVLAPIFGVLVPPAGVAFGHLALPQINRTGERGWLAAVCGLVLGYLMCVVLVIALISLFAIREPGATNTPAASKPIATPSETVVTSVAPVPMRPRTKIDLNQAGVGQCVEIQLREGGDPEALDLFLVRCEHRVGVYTVAARVATDGDCNSTYVAVPPSRAFAICLTRY